MEPSWKVDLKNPGACKSLSKELAADIPNFKLFISQQLLSDPGLITPEDIYKFFLPIIRSQQKELYFLETELENSKSSKFEYQQKLDQLQQESLKGSRGRFPQQEKSLVPSISRRDCIIITSGNLKLWNSAATKIQKVWKGTLAKIHYKRKISEIITKVRPTGPRSLPNKQIMEIVSKEIEKKKLTMEQFYRAADKDSDGKLSFEEMKSFMDDLKIVLPRSTLTRFMQIVDEDCSGIIDKKEFTNALSAYCVASETTESDRTFEEEMLLKLVKIMDSRGIEPENLFSMCDTDSTGTMSLKELEVYLIKLKVGFQVKEVHALMRRLDSDKNGELTLEEFKNHFNKGQNFFKQEIVASTHSMMPVQSKPSNEVPGIRDLFRTLEYTGNFMHFLVNLKSLPSSQTSVSSFFVTLEKMFNCKLNKGQLETLRKVLVLNEKGLVSWENFKPTVVFYTTKSLETRENYLLRVKMHLPKQKPEEKIFTRKEMVEELFFSPEQCMEAIQFLADPGEEYFSSDMLYADEQDMEHSIDQFDGVKVVEYFKEKIKESGLDIKNIFRFADKKNEGEIPVDHFCNACERLLKNVERSYFEDLKRVIDSDYVGLVKLMELFPPYKLDMNGLTVEAVHWLRYLGKTFRDAKITSLEFFNSITPNSQGKASYSAIKLKIKEKFESVILAIRFSLISEHVFPDDSCQIDSDSFIKLFLQCQNTDHTITDLKEYERKVQKMIDDERKILPPPSIKPVIPTKPQPPPQNKLVFKPSNLLENDDLANSLKKISQKVPEGTWCFDLLLSYNLSLEFIFANESSLFTFTENFGITKIENHDIYIEIVKRNNDSPLVYAYQFCCFVDIVTHSLSNLPFKWNKTMAASTGSAFERYIREKKLRKIDLLSLFKSISRKINLIDFEEFGVESEKIPGFFHHSSPIYHLLTVLDSYIDVKIHSVFNIMKSRIFFNRDFFFQDRKIETCYKDKFDVKVSLLDSIFTPLEADIIIEFLYPKFNNNLPYYSFKYLVDVVSENRKKFEISFDPFNTAETDPENRKYFENLSKAIRLPLFYYFGNNNFTELISVQTLKQMVSEHYAAKEAFRLESIFKVDASLNSFKISIPVYHFVAVLDSYRSEPANLFFSLKKIFDIFNPEEDRGRRNRFMIEIGNLNKEKAFNQQDIITKIIENLKKGDKNFTELTSDEKSDITFFFDPYRNKKEVYGYQLICLNDLCENFEKLNTFPFMHNNSIPKELSDQFFGISNLLETNNISTLSLTSINLDKRITASDLNTIKKLETFRNHWPAILKSLGGDNIPFFYFLTAIESYLPHSISTVDTKKLGVFPENFLRQIDKSKKLITIFKNPPLNHIYEYKDFKLLFTTSFPGISDEIIERLFKKFDKRSFNKIFMYEILTAIDLMQKVSSLNREIRFMYVDEFQAMQENSERTNQEYLIKKNAHKLYIQLAEIFDENNYATMKVRSFYDLSNRQIRQEYSGFEKISLDDLRKYIFRATNKNVDMAPIFENLKIDGEVCFYHFFAVFESYRKRVIIDKYKVENDTSVISATAYMDRNPNDIVFPVDTKVIIPGTYSDTLYQLKKLIKENYKEIYNKLKSNNKNSQFLDYESFKQFIREIYPRISEAHQIELIKNVDRDKDRKIDYEEFFYYIFTQPFDKPQPKSIPKPVSDRDLQKSDFFDPRNVGLTTILNSEEAVIIRCKQLLSKLPPNSIFHDEEFGEKTGIKGNTCLYWNGKPPSSSYPDPKSKEFVWKSCNEAFLNAKFIRGGTGSGDVIQGSLGDCWFIGALSVMALRDDLLYGNIESLSSPEEITKETGKLIRKGVYSALFQGLSKCGMYVFKFFINSAWRWVIVDDSIPMFESAEVNEFHYVFGHCKDPEELWVPLIEKAYAKVFGCYEALNGGLIDDGLTDLTGLVAEKCKITGKGGVLDGDPNNPVKTEELWARLVRYRADRTLMGCSIEGDGVEGDVVIDGVRTGLLSRHAYAIIDVFEISNPNARKKRHRLIRIRNPWGQREWQGRWCDGSEELEMFSEKIHEITALLGDEEKFSKFDPNDGTFFMNFKSWRNIYHNLYACVDFSEKWSGLRFSGNWTAENSGGVPMSGTPNECIRWAKNPQYCIELTKDTEIFINLSQEDGRYVLNSKFPFEETINTACFTIMRGAPEELQLKKFEQAKIVKLSVLKAHRNVEMRISLKAGKYFIVPSTMQEGKIGKFWISFYFDCAKREISIYDCRDANLRGEVIYEEEEDEGPLSDEDLDKLRQTFASLNRA